MIQDFGHARLDLLAQNVFPTLGLVVHFVPGHAQRLRQKSFDQAMMTNDFQRHAFAGCDVSSTPW